MTLHFSTLLQAASDWLHVYPRGFLDLLLYTKEKYHNPLIYITENGKFSYFFFFQLFSHNFMESGPFERNIYNYIVGIDEVNNATLSLEEALVDNQRIEYYYSHLWYLRKAIM
jgi:beta-glucosidase